MAVRTITTSIKLDGEAEFKKQMSSVNNELKNLKSDMALVNSEFKGQANTTEALTEKSKLLNKQVEQQKEKVSALERALQEASEAYGENDRRTDSYKQQLNNAKVALNNMNDELNQNEKYLDEAKESADQCARSIDGFGREVKQADKELANMDSELGGVGGGLGDFADKLGGLKGIIAGGAIVGGLGAIKDSVLGVVDSTEEYRKVMGTLEVSSQNAGYTTDQTTETYRRLHAVLGDTQTAATATANLQAIGLSQEDLMVVTDAAIGAWAQYGDSIPIDGLSEAINETVKVGQVTGTFADVLNWAGVSEDDFNTKLQECSSESERANLVMQELARQGLAKSGQGWRENNQDIVEMNEATAELDEAMGRLGEILAPLAADFMNFAADSLTFVIDKISSAVNWFKKLDNSITNTRLNAEAGIDLNTSSKKNGSHKLGLTSVPYDGYIAELHKGERVLTADEARVLSSLSSANLRTNSNQITVETLNSSIAGVVNGMAAFAGGNQSSGQPIIVKTYLDSREIAKSIYDPLKDVSRQKGAAK